MPGPPYQRPYNYFVWDAKREIEANRLTWTRADTASTIAAIWAGDATVKAHYANSMGAAPGPQLPAPNPIPAIPYTAAEAQSAKRGNGLPVRAPAVVEEEEEEEEEEEGGGGGGGGGGEDPKSPDATRTGSPEGSKQLGPETSEHSSQNGEELPGPENNVQPQASDPTIAPVTAVGRVDELPYDFWPKLPWTPMPPNLPSIDRQTAGDKDKLKAWIATRPHRAMDGEDRWRGAKFIGAGSCGAAGLWMEADEHNNIRDIMVVKDAKHSAAYWRDPKNWRNSLPKELENHRLIEERRQTEADMCRYLIYCRGHRLYMAQKRYRLYLDYYNAGDLWAPVHRQSETEAEVIPEAFIWYMLRALASACLVLQCGTTADEPLLNWKPITHLDIVLTNVFTRTIKRERDDESDEPSESAAEPGLPIKRRKKLPSMHSNDDEEEGGRTEWSTADWDNVPVQPVLADFDNAFYSLDNGCCPISDNPEDHIYHADHPRYPPERQRQSGPPWIRLNEKTDVWGIGSVLYMLVANAALEHGPIREDGANFDIPLASHAPHHSQNQEPHGLYTVLSGAFYDAAHEYSTDLRQLVSSCLEWDQDKRPTLRSLFDTALKQLNKAGMKKALMEWEGFDLTEHAELFELGVSVEHALSALTSGSESEDYNEQMGE